MRYGVLVVTPITEEEDRSFINLGDMIQTEAILYMYQKMGISREEVIRIDIKDLAEYKGEYLILPININLSNNWLINIFPLPSHIIPVFLGLSFFSSEKLSAELRDYFRLYAPIGCRDEFTLELMRENQIPAYLFGCVTAFLPYMERRQKGNTVFLVDVPASFEEYGKIQLCKYDKVERISHICNNEKFRNYKYIEKVTAELLKRYSNEAMLVITSRLHCMSPCMAMGIPVIPVTDNISPRMSWIDKFLRIFTPEDYEKIDWQGEKVFYEEEKKLMLDIAIQKVNECREKYEKIMDISYFYEIRPKSIYGNYYRNILKKLTPLERTKKLEYILWGSGQIGIHAYRIITQTFPESKLIAVIDSYCDGSFFGVTIERPDALNTYNHGYIFITTTSGEKYAKEYLLKLGKKEGRDFLSMATTSG